MNSLPLRPGVISANAKILRAMGATHHIHPPGKLTMVVAALRLSTIAGCDKVVDLRNKSAVLAEAAT